MTAERSNRPRPWLGWIQVCSGGKRMPVGCDGRFRSKIVELFEGVIVRNVLDKVERGLEVGSLSSVARDRPVSGVFRLAPPLCVSVHFAGGSSCAHASLYCLHEFSSFPTVWFAARRAEAPLSYDCHNLYSRIDEETDKTSFDRRFLLPFQRWVERFCIPRVAVIFSVSESLADLLNQSYGVKAIILRYCHDDRLNTRESLTSAPAPALNRYRALKKLPLKVDNQGLASRDFIYVEDIARGLMRCATNGKPGDVYNVASGVETSILELATLINQLTGNPASIEFLPARSWDRSGRRFGSAEKAKRAIGFEACVTLLDGLARTVEWTHRNLAIINECMRKHDAQMKAFAGV